MSVISEKLEGVHISPKTDSSNEDHKFGTILGVFIPCILMLFGVIIFLRLGWVVGHVGLPLAIFIITFAALVALITTLSMASIATNIEVGKGGIYYIISRSLGIEIGATLGLPLYIKQTLSVSFCAVGFAESLHDLIPAFSITSIGIWTLVGLTIIAYTSVKGALKVQGVICAAIALAFISLFTGGNLKEMHPDTFTPAINYKLGFWAIFAIFFPAMTGLESSVSLSGDLKNPSRSLTLGTIAAIVVAYLAYIAVAIFAHHHVPMQRLVDDPLILQDLASFPSLIILGIWGATLSSALGGMLGAPRTLQAMSEDGIIPKFLGKSYGEADEPRIATLVTFFVAFIAVYYGSINLIAPLMTMICLVCYLVLNLSAGLETLMANPSWRPRFRLHWMVSMTGAWLCFFTMLMIDAGYALLSFGLLTVIYFCVKKYKFKATWDDIRQGIYVLISRFALYNLVGSKNLSKSWRPHFLVFAKTAEEYSSNLLNFSEAISQSKSFLTMASFVTETNLSKDKRDAFANKVSERLHKKNIEAFVSVRGTDRVTDEMKQMIKHYGLGPLRPNTLLFGGVKHKTKFAEFISVLKVAEENNCNVIIMNDEIKGEPLKSKKKKVGDIHIWWDHENQDNSELMLVFAYMLQRNRAWSRNRICLKATVPDERAKTIKIEEFQALSARLRLPIDIDIYVTNDPKNEIHHFVKIFSKDAEIVFMSLASLPESPEEFEDYDRYLNEVLIREPGFPDVALVLNSEHTPLDSILM